MRRGDDANASLGFKKVLMLDPTNAGDYDHLRSTLSGDIEIVRNLKKAIYCDPKSGSDTFSLGAY